MRHHYVIITSSLLCHHYVILSGTPINVESNHFEAKMAMASIQQNVGYSGMLQEISPNTSLVNSQTLVNSDMTRTRRSQENMPKVKKNRLQKVYQQKQYQGKSLTQYRGKKKQDENETPSESFLCSETKNMALKK